MRLPTRFALFAAILAIPVVACADTPDPRPHVILANVDPAILAHPALAAPIVFAQTLGIPRVITWASTTGNSGLAWGSTASITAANAYLTYNATNVVLSAPSGKGVALAEAGVPLLTATAASGTIITASASYVGHAELQLDGASVGTYSAVSFYRGGAEKWIISEALNDADISLFNDALGANVATFLATGAVSFPAGTVTAKGAAIFTSNTVPAGSNAFAGYDGTNVVLNAPTGKGFSFTTNGVETAAISLAGFVLTDVIQMHTPATVLSINDSSGNGGVYFYDAGTTINTELDGILYFSQTFGETDISLSDSGAADVLTVIAAGGTLIDGSQDVVQLTVQGNATQTALPFVVENSGGTDQFTVSNAGSIAFVGGVAVPTSAVKTGTYAALITDYLVPVSINGGWTLTLPAANAAAGTPGQILVIKCTDTDVTNRVTVARAGADTITTTLAAAQTSFTACSAGTLDSYELVSDGTSVWYMTGFL